MNHSPVQGNAQCLNQMCLEVESSVEMFLWLVSSYQLPFFGCILHFLHAVRDIKHVSQTMKIKETFVA